MTATRKFQRGVHLPSASIHTLACGEVLGPRGLSGSIHRTHKSCHLKMEKNHSGGMSPCTPALAPIS